MANKPRDQVQRELEIIRRLLNVNNLKDHEVIQQLQINERTFYRYKARIMAQETKIWEKQNKDRAAYDLGKFIETLEHGYIINKRISEDTQQPARDRIEATKAMAVFKAQIAKLSRDGPITILYPSQSSLPNKVVENEKELKI